MKLKSGLMWMGAGLLVGSCYRGHKKQIDSVMDNISKKATKKVTNMVNKM